MYFWTICGLQQCRRIALWSLWYVGISTVGISKLTYGNLTINWWRAANCDLCSALIAIKQWGHLSVPHLLWHGAYVNNGHPRGYDNCYSIPSTWFNIFFSFWNMKIAQIIFNESLEINFTYLPFVVFQPSWKFLYFYHYW